MAAGPAPRPPEAAARQDLFRGAELRGLRLAFQIRAAVFGALAIYLPFETTITPLAYYYPLIALALALGALPLLGARFQFGGQWLRYVCATAEAALIAVAVGLPNPFDPGEFLPHAARFKSDNLMYPLILVSLYSLSFSPRLVLWSGAAMALFWLAVMGWASLQPDFGPRAALPGGWAKASAEARTAFLHDPYDLKPLTIVKQILLIMIASSVAAVVVARGRSLVLRQGRAERAQANLARYFSPNIVADLARADRPLTETRSTPAAVLFADVVRFTEFAESRTPDETIATLRELFGHLVECVFRHGGTLDKFLGDGLMATFGTPAPGQADAVRALACAHDMAAVVARWNEGRGRAGLPTLELGFGIHWGTVVLGDIGGEGRFEFATLGDTVNVASRIEAATRELEAEIAVSAELAAAAEAQDKDRAAALLAGFAARPGHVLRGRAQRIDLLIRPRKPRLAAAGGGV